MQPQENFNNSAGAGHNPEVNCTQCGAPMPREMRFCRACGHRLGEGPAEYTETVRLSGDTTAVPRVTGAYIPPQAAPLATQTGKGFPYKRRRKLGGMVWVLIVIAFFFVSGAIMSVLKKRGPNVPRASIGIMNRSYFGVNDFVDAEGGVSFANVEPPDSPADKAGLVGGDIVITFDGQSELDERRIMSLLGQTAPGKTVEVIYTRDGEVKKTQLTTVSRAEFQDLERAFRDRPFGQGQLGFDDDEAEVVSIDDKKIKGVQLNKVSPSGPAALAGMQDGDIITEFDGVPIRTTEELVFRVRRAVPYSTVKVVLFRGGQQLALPIKIGKR